MSVQRLVYHFRVRPLSESIHQCCWNISGTWPGVYSYRFHGGNFEIWIENVEFWRRDFICLSMICLSRRGVVKGYQALRTRKVHCSCVHAETRSRRSVFHHPISQGFLVSNVYQTDDSLNFQLTTFITPPEPVLFESKKSRILDCSKIRDIRFVVRPIG